MAKKKNYNSLEERRTRNWASILYEESAYFNWRDILASMHIDAFVSPYHDKDITATGEPKKPHYHIILMFSSVKSYDQAKEIFLELGAVGCEFVQSLRAYCRYLCHLDNPEKYRYNTSDVVTFGGVDYLSICSSASDKFVIIRQILQFIEENDIRFFNDLALYASSENEEWFRVLCDSNTMFISQYLKSRTYKIKEG